MQAAWATAAEDRRAEFEARGWLVLRGVVSAPDLAELNGIFDEVMAPYLVPGGDSSGVRLRPNACQAHGAMLRHLHDGVAEIACHLLGAPSIRLLQDALLLKHPSARGSIALHQDYSYTGFLDPPSIVSVGLALNDASAESGCLHVIDGSHTWGLVGGLADLCRRAAAGSRPAAVVGPTRGRGVAAGSRSKFVPATSRSITA